MFDVDLDVDPIFDVDGSAAVRRRLTPSSTKTLVVAYQRMAARGRSTCKSSSEAVHEDNVEVDDGVYVQRRRHLNVRVNVDVFVEVNGDRRNASLERY